MTVAVVTPWRDHPELVNDYFAALTVGPPPDELWVVDDGSEDPIYWAKLHNDTPRGFCHASNRGLHAATADVVVLLNNDIAPGEAMWLRKLVEAVEPGVLAGPVLRRDAHGDVDGQPFPYLDGWCLAGTRNDLLTLGGFDETFQEPAYYSDNDLCLRAREAGMTLRETPLRLAHKGNVTAGGFHDPAVKAAKAANYERYADRARKALVAA